MDLPKLGIAYALVPFKRNQDVVKIHEFGNGEYCIAVADGWNRPEALPGDEPGREVAQIVASEYPTMFLKFGREASKKLDERIAKKYPKYVSAVAAFLFHSPIRDTVVSIGDVETYLWNGKQWYKPKEISDHWLDERKYPGNVSRFFGASEQKADPRFPGIFSAEPDVIQIKQTASVIIATDGIKDVLSIKDIDAIVGNPRGQKPKKIVDKFLKEIQQRKTQKDDISVLVRTPKN